MRIFLAIAAILAWIFGLGQLLAPARFYAPMGIELTPMLATMVQSYGATMIGLGVINWCAREAQGRGLFAVLLGNLFVQVLNLGVVFRMLSLGAGKTAAPGVVIHVVLGGFFLYFLLRERKQESTGMSAART
ncbi:MAG TPA: hypothetical protein VJO35_06725 [Terriglobales bacterium]|nr:hypothetical protein [Terriglobales bacterium]